MASLGKDLVYSLRTLIKQPGFTVIAILTLAIGIGANTTIFSVVKAVLLQPLPYESPDRLVWIWETNHREDIPFEPASVPNFYDWKAQNQVFTDMAAFGTFRPVLTEDGGEAERIPGGYATPNLFRVLGATPSLGREFTEEEGREEGDLVVMLSHGLWQRRFGGDPQVLGRAITLNGRSRIIVGVMPASYRHLDMDGEPASQLWVPVVFDPETSNRRSDFLDVVARMKPGIELERARTDMETIASRLEQQYPDTNSGWTITMVGLKDRFSGSVRDSLIVLLAAVGFLLLIAVANVANLQLARATARGRETAIRSALGAGRWQLIRQYLVESSLIGIGGGVAGLLIAIWGVEILLALRPSELPTINAIEIDGTVLGFTLALSLLTGLLFGIVPALQASRTDVRGAMESGGRGSGAGGIGGSRMRNTLVVAEVAVALVMLVGAGLMVRSLAFMNRIDPGVDVERTLTARIQLPNASYEEDHQVRAFYRELLDSVRALPGVSAVAATSDLPVTSGGMYLAFAIEGRVAGPGDAMTDAVTKIVTPGYFETMGVPLVEGRWLAASDHEDAPLVTVINETMARNYWPGERAIGHRINLGFPDEDSWIEIVGVVRDVHDESLDAVPYPQMYGSHPQWNNRSMSLTVRTAGEPVAQVPAIRGAVRRIDPELPVTGIRTMEAIVAESLSQRRFSMILLAAFSGVALLLASIGIYGVISYSVSRRTREIGIRMALGARRGDVRRMVVGNGVLLAAFGIGIGLVAASGLTWLMSSLVFGVSTKDPVTFAGIAVLLCAVALLASYVPARRATRVDPMIALRYE